MSRTLTNSFLIASALTIGAVGVSACGSDKAKKPDTGDVDSGARSDAGNNGSTGDGSTGGPVVVMCGGEECSDLQVQTTTLKAGCAKNSQDKEVCGLSTEFLAAAQAAGVKYAERNAPGVESASCGAILDKYLDNDSEETISTKFTEMDAAVPDFPAGKFTNYSEFKLGPATAIAISEFTACCTKAGRCSINFGNPAVSLNGNSLGPSDLGYGCADPASVGINAGAKLIGFGEDGIGCDPATGKVNEEQVVTDAGAGAGDAGTDGGN